MREIKFRAWDIRISKMLSYDEMKDGGWDNYPTLYFAITEPKEYIPMQFTGLHDKKGFTNVYEGDILDENGVVKGNVYESPSLFRTGIDCIITGMGTSAWRSTESIAM